MAAKCDVIEQLRQRVAELEELLSTREDDLGIERHWVKTTSEKLAASEKRVAELEAEKAEAEEVSAIQIANLTSRLESLLIKYAALKEKGN